MQAPATHREPSDILNAFKLCYTFKRHKVTEDGEREISMAIDPHTHDEEPLQGIPMTDEAFELLISVESPYHYELIDGIAYDMTGSSPEHGVTAGNMYMLFREQLGRGGPCRVYQEQYVAIPNQPPVAPDVVLTCDRADWDKQQRLKPFRVQSPLIVVEVLSPSTERYDRGGKFIKYQTCTSLEVYILVHQKKQLVEVYRRSTNWQQELFTEGQTIQLDQLDLTFPLEEIYAGVFEE